ncbi:MAG: hypothetical protein J0L77_08105 [Alphaproteobacteria bacterium]|nr:hypothetical protein [Alphaproteobacteria bacterium]
MKFIDWVRLIVGIAVAATIAVNFNKITQLIEEEIYYADTGGDAYDEY